MPSRVYIIFFYARDLFWHLKITTKIYHLVDKPMVWEKYMKQINLVLNHIVPSFGAMVGHWCNSCLYPFEQYCIKLYLHMKLLPHTLRYIRSPIIHMKLDYDRLVAIYSGTKENTHEDTLMYLSSQVVRLTTRLSLLS